MRSRHALRNGLLFVGPIALFGACSSNVDTPASSPSAEPPSSSAPSITAGANGELYTSVFGGGETTLRRYPIAADGSVGDPVVILKAAGGDTTFPSVVDSRGQNLLTGTYGDFWTTALQQRDLNGTEKSSLTVDKWCGGEGLVANQCALLDGARLARTTELGGEETTEGSVIISDVTNGATLGQYGPFPGLSRMLGTSQANVVLLATTTEKSDVEDPSAPGTIQRLDTTSGATADVADFPKNWSALCAVGVDGVIGVTQDAKPKIVPVGTATVGDVTITANDLLVGCSADGAFVYVQNVPQPPKGEEDDEAPSTASSLERINLATGARDTIAAMSAGELVAATTH